MGNFTLEQRGNKFGATLLPTHDTWSSKNILVRYKHLFGYRVT